MALRQRLHVMMDFVVLKIKYFSLSGWITIFAFSLLQTTANAGCDFDDFPVMDEMQVQSIMEDADYNNRPMMVRAFVSEAGYQQVVDHYHRQWKDFFDDTSFGIWHQITTMTDECMMTVQVTPQGLSGSHGRLIISNPPTTESADIGVGLLMPGDAIVISDLKTDDGPKQGRVSMLASADSVSGVAKFYISEMQNDGWGLDRQFREQDAMVLVFRKGLDVTNIVMVPAGDMTQILINEERVQ